MSLCAVAITQLLPRPRALVVDTFTSKQDVINALLASCWIPGYFGVRPFILFRGAACIDGAFSVFAPASAAKMTVKVFFYF